MGDLADLVPAEARAGRTPDQATDAELLDAAQVVLDRLGLTSAGSLDEALDLVAGCLQRGTKAQ